jgi:Kef-type K+ transport system membrane component KefB
MGTTSSFASNSSMDPTSSPDLNLQNNSKLILGVNDLSEAYLPSPKTFLGFTIVCTSSYYFAGFFPSLKLPKITGYLIMGIIAGPFVLNLVPKSEVRSLRAVDETSLAFIAFAAGGKIYLKKMRPIKKTLGWICFLLIVLEYLVGFGMVMAVRNTFEFLSAMDDSSQIAVALLAGALMIARSPSSALAIVRETSSKGRFTDIMLGVTILSDVAVLVIYNINTLIAEAVLSDATNGGMAIVYIFARLGLAGVVGFLLALLLNFLIFWRPRIRRKSVFYPVEQIFKHFIFLSAGLLVYFISKLTHPWTDSLLTCMVTGLALTNFSNNRTELTRMIQRLDSFVYCAFFTLTGASLELDIMVHAFAIACVLVVSRIVALFVGSYYGGIIAGESKEESKYSGFCYITQAGVTLGLAKEVHLNFPGW